MMKSDLTSSRISGKRKISAVPVFWSRPAGARMSGRGKGRPVRNGFVLKAVVSASEAEGGHIKVMPGSCQQQMHQ